MPTYQYSCTECGHFFEIVQSFSEDSLTVCPVCEGRLRKVFNAVGVVFKGSGFYRNDSRGSDPAASSSGSSGSSSNGAETSSGQGSGTSSPKSSGSSNGSGASSSSSGSSGSSSTSGASGSSGGSSSGGSGS